MDQERQLTIKCSDIMQVKPLRFLLTANFCKDFAVPRPGTFDIVLLFQFLQQEMVLCREVLVYGQSSAFQLTPCLDHGIPEVTGKETDDGAG